MILVSKYTAIRQQINSHILEALSIYTDDEKSSDIAKSKVWVRKSKEICKVLYTSEVAFKLSKVYGISASAIANQIVSHFGDCNNNFVLKVAAGLIHIEVADTVVAACLQSLVEQYHPPVLVHSHTPTLVSSHTGSFFIQYAHARCCSLVRLALQQRLISFDQSLQIPWLDSQSKLRFTSLESQRLIANLVEVVDELVCVDIRPDSYWHSKALNLSQAFICFWRHTCIWGSQTQLARAYIGLIVATQEILRLILEEKLNSVACLEI